MSKLRVDIWSDIACPWCYIGKRRIEGALAQLEQRDDVEVHWRAFELDPQAPKIRDTTQSQAQRIAAKYKLPVEQAQVMIDRVASTAAKDGLDFQMEQVIGGNTFDAHRLLHLAGLRGKQDALKERFLRAYFTEGRAIGDTATLAELAIDVGLDATEVNALLASDQYATDVRDDERLARELGISGVPFFVIDGRLGVSGAQPVEVLRGALEQGFRDRGLKVVDGAATADDDSACGPDGCALPA